jgi:hypothetical protein
MADDIKSIRYKRVTDIPTIETLPFSDLS